MKSGTETKSKFKKLQRRLNLSLWECTGLLESIWRVCVQNTPCGDIGRLSNEDIAALIEWDRDADELIQALVDYSWLDECCEHRLVVHDWRFHAPNFIKGALAKHGLRMIEHPAKQDKEQDAKQAAKHGARQYATYPSLSNPNQANPIPNAADAAPTEARTAEEPPPAKPRKSAPPPEELPLPAALDEPHFAAAWSAWLEYRRSRRLTMRAQTLQAQLEALADVGPASAAECIRASIRNGWQGLFPEKANGARASPAPKSGYGQRALEICFPDGVPHEAN